MATSGAELESLTVDPLDGDDGRLITGPGAGVGLGAGGGLGVGEGAGAGSPKPGGSRDSGELCPNTGRDKARAATPAVASDICFRRTRIA